MKSVEFHFKNRREFKQREELCKESREEMRVKEVSDIKRLLALFCWWHISKKNPKHFLEL
jgi:hypothetical protein